MNTKSLKDGFLGVELHNPDPPALTGEIAGLLESPGLIPLGEVDVFDSLTKRLDRKRHGLEIPIRGDKYSRVIPVLVGLGEHINSDLDIHALFLEYAPVVYPAFLKVPKAKDHLTNCLDAGVITPLGRDLRGSIGSGRGHVVVENARNHPSPREPLRKAGDVNVCGPATANEPVVKVAPVDEDGDTVWGSFFGAVCHNQS